jgi:predicted nucleic acid-binding protein
MTLVIDASVAIKWYVKQPYSEAAGSLAEGEAALIAPDALLAEAGSALWKYVRAGEMSVEHARTVLARLPAHFETLFPLPPLADEALEIAVAIRHPIYDCFYLAVARRENAPVVTADKRLAAAAQALASVEVRLLSGI